MPTSITCARCGFLLGFTDEPVRYAGPDCPACGAPLATETAQSGRCVVVDQLGQPVAGPFSSAAAATLWIASNRFWDHPRGPLEIVPADNGTAPRRAAVERERVPALIDALDARLALWIAQSTLSDNDAA